MTIRQINEVYFHPRDKDGGLKLDAPDMGGGETYEESFRGIWRARGADAGQLDRLWVAFLDLEGAKRHEGVRRGMLAISGEVISAVGEQQLEEDFRGRWVETVKGIMGHG